MAALGTQVVYENDFETDAAGWTIVAGASRGNWERAQPIGTQYLGNPCAPDDDAQAGALDWCFVTENLNTTSALVADVDGGPTELISPVLDYSGTDGSIGFQAWFYSSGAEDKLQVDVTNNGSTWVAVMAITPVPGVSNQWLQYGFRVSEFVTPSSTVRVRFSVGRLGQRLGCRSRYRSVHRRCVHLPDLPADGRRGAADRNRPARDVRR